MRIGQKAAGYLGSYTWLRAISRRSGGWLARKSPTAAALRRRSESGMRMSANETRSSFADACSLKPVSGKLEHQPARSSVRHRQGERRLRHDSRSHIHDERRLRHADRRIPPYMDRPRTQRRWLRRPGGRINQEPTDRKQLSSSSPRFLRLSSTDEGRSDCSRNRPFFVKP